jgi:superfamily II RNA helicase
MTFHYDFLLKTLQSGNLDWIDLLHKSYWFQRHRLYVEEVEGEIVKAEAAAAGTGLTDVEVADMTVYDSLNQRLKESVNAAKKEAQKALGQWNNGRQGPRWHQVQKELWPQKKKAVAEVAQLRAELAAAENPAEGVWPSLDALAGMGLLHSPVERTGPSLTALGIMATEINEGHSILMAQLYRSGLLEHEAPDVIMAVLAGFIIEGKVDPVPLESLDIPRQVVGALKAVKGMAAEAQRIEGTVGARRPKEGYWAVSSMWVEPVWRWLGGESLQRLCEEYETYEGNMIRIFMKLANILEEWRSLASYCEHAEMLEKMRDFEREILKDVVICDSLYLGL